MLAIEVYEVEETLIDKVKTFFKNMFKKKPF